MNFHVQGLTPTQLAIKERRANFRKAIAEKAAELATPKELIPEVEAPPRQPFEILSKPTASAPVSDQAIWPWPHPIFSARGETPSILEIQVEVAKYYGIGVGDLLAGRRTLKMVRPRQVACYLC